MSFIFLEKGQNGDIGDIFGGSKRAAKGPIGP